MKYLMTIVLLIATLTANAGIKDRLEGKVTFVENYFTCDTGSLFDTELAIQFSSENKVKAFVKTLGAYEHVSITEMDADYIVVDYYGASFALPMDDKDTYYYDGNKMDCTYTAASF